MLAAFPAYQEMLPDLVRAEERGAAISLSSAQFNLGWVIGPPLAGLAVVADGYGWAFALNAAAFFAVLVALRLVHLPAPDVGGEVVSLRRLADATRATAGNPGARFAVTLTSVVALTVSPFIAQGIGTVAGALYLTPLVHRYGRRRVLLGDIAGVCVFLLAYAASPDLWLGAAAVLLVGASYIGVLAGCNTIVQI